MCSYIYMVRMWKLKHNGEVRGRGVLILDHRQLITTFIPTVFYNDPFLTRAVPMFRARIFFRRHLYAFSSLLWVVQITENSAIVPILRWGDRSASLLSHFSNEESLEQRKIAVFRLVAKRCSCRLQWSPPPAPLTRSSSSRTTTALLSSPTDPQTKTFARASAPALAM